MHKDIIEIFSLICKPFKDKQGGEKLDVIQELLDGVNISNEYIPGIGLIMNKQDMPRVVLTSHMDLIRKFQKGFEEGITHEIVLSKKNKEIIKGALDNTITNAVALLLLEKLLEDGVTDVEFVLTEGEEVGMKGMEAYIAAYPGKSAATFFVNLDVTNEGWKKDISIEYDAPNFQMLKQVQGILSEHSTHYTRYRVGDDIDAVIEAQCSGFSYCLPTKDLIHSYENQAYVESLSGYFFGLEKLLKEVTTDFDFDETFDGFYFSKALELETLEDFVQYKKDNAPVSTFSRSSYDPRSFTMGRTPVVVKEKKPLTPEVVKEREIFIDIASDMIRKEFGVDTLTMEELSGFIEYQVMEDESFYLSEFALLFKFKKDHFAFSRKILDWLVDTGYVEEITLSEYQFKI